MIMCIKCNAGCFGDTSCVDVIDGTSLITADCCKAGGVAILQHFVLCTPLDCPGEVIVIRLTVVSYVAKNVKST